METLSECRILLVDDTKTNIDALIGALKSEYRLAVAMDGCNAVDYCRNRPPDLVLLDVRMPGMDGFDVCRTLKEEPATRDIPIIFITGADRPEDKLEGFEAGAVDYITKPFDAPEVRARVRTHLSLLRIQRALRDRNEILEEKVSVRARELKDLQVEILERLQRAADYHDRKSDPPYVGLADCLNMLAGAAGESDEDARMLALAGTLHDVGKIGVPDAILTRTAPLAPEERRLMRQHTVIGARLLSGSRHPLLRMAETIAHSHHERWDGRGYPEGLRGEAIPRIGRIASICIAFEETIRAVSGEASEPVDRGMAMVAEGAGSRFDPALAAAFLRQEEPIRGLIRERRGP